MPTFHATVTLEISPLADVHGEEVTDLPQHHVLSWLCAGQQNFEDFRNGFSFEVCPTHPDPDTCDCNAVVLHHAVILDADTCN
jgi:hypothetical protein